MPNRLPSITIEGGPELAALLKDLSDKQILDAAKKGFRSVGSKVVRDAKRRLTRGHGLQSGQLKRSLGIRKLLTYKREGRIVMYLGPRRGFKVGESIRAVQRLKNKRQGRMGHDPFYIAHLVEFGHRASGWNVNGPAVPAKPFLRPAVDANKGEFAKQMADKVKSVLEKAKAKKA